MKNIFFKLSTLISVLIPSYVFAQDRPVLGGTTKLFEGFWSILTGYIVPMVFTLAMVYFFYGVAKYIKSEGTGKAEGKNIMLWGVIAIAVMSSVWGLVYFLQGELGINNTVKGGMPSIDYNAQ